MAPRWELSPALYGFGLIFVFCANQLVTRSQDALANAARDVEVCSILKDPTSFDGQLVRLRGRLEMEFEEDVVDDESCDPKPLHTAIWWGYGGTPIAALEPDARQIRATTKPFLKDAEAAQFTAHTYARREHRPDGQPCTSSRECSYYDVTATFTGRFFAGKKSPGGRLGGFGHKGCCHLFVIEQISNVVAERSPVPLDSQTFLCTNETWSSEFEYAPTPHTTLEDAMALRAAANKKLISDQIHMHDGATFDQSLKSRALGYYSGLNESLTWSSPDLLTTYRVEFPHPGNNKTAEKQKHEPRPHSPFNVNVIRERCEPASSVSALRNLQPSQESPHAS